MVTKPGHLGSEPFSFQSKENQVFPSVNIDGFLLTLWPGSHLKPFSTKLPVFVCLWLVCAPDEQQQSWFVDSSWRLIIFVESNTVYSPGLGTVHLHPVGSLLWRWGSWKGGCQVWSMLRVFMVTSVSVYIIKNSIMSWFIADMSNCWVPVPVLLRSCW